MTLFDPRPKKKESELFGRTRDLSNLNRLIQDKEPLIVISGLKRIGKTSLIKTALSTKDFAIFIDGWKLAQAGIITKSEIMELFHNEINKFLHHHKSKKDQFKKFLSSVAGIQFGEFGIQFHPPAVNEVNLSSLFDALNEWAIDNNEIIVLAVDEVQEFSAAKDVDLRKIFSSLYNHENFVVILTGSNVGLLYDFLKKEDESSPLYGKDRVSVVLQPLTKSQSRDFLLKGFAEAGLNINRTIPYDRLLDTAVTELGGIIGWLVIFGRQCVREGKISENTIQETQEIGSKQIRAEFNKFASKTGELKKYTMIMLELVKSPHFKFHCYIQDNNLDNYIQRLEREGFVIKDEKERYHFSDQLLSYSFRKDVEVIDLRKRKHTSKSKKSVNKRR